PSLLEAVLDKFEEGTVLSFQGTRLDSIQLAMQKEQANSFSF
ncbi:hypothetical protein ACFMJX_30610, partial [Acinetobacter baumannii]